MTNAFRCPETGLVEWFDAPGRYRCPYCRKMHHTYPSGAPPVQEGAPNVIGDRLPKHHDFSCGCDIDSKAQRRRIYKAKGLNVSSVAEVTKAEGIDRGWRRTITSYPGQTKHRSVFERGERD